MNKKIIWHDFYSLSFSLSDSENIYRLNTLQYEFTNFVIPRVMYDLIIANFDVKKIILVN